MVVAQTGRLLLRTASLEDAPFYLALLNDPAFIEHIGDRHIRSVAGARIALAEGPIAMQAAYGHALYIVELKAGGVPIGMCGLIKRETLADVDIGYAFLPQYWGQGYALEAAVAVLGHARALGLERVVAITAPANVGSNRLLRKLGMQFVDVLHITPDDPGTNLYACTLTERAP